MRDEASDHSDDAATPSVGLSGIASRLFIIWRRVIATVALWPVRVGRAMTTLARAWISQWRAALRYHLNADSPWKAADVKDREVAAALGLRAFAFGLIALAVLTASSRNAWGPGAVAAAGELLWAGMRFIIIALLMPHGAIDRPRLSVAFLAGLAPFALGVTWLLRLVALGLSALLTYRGLRGAGVSRDDTRVVVGWAFGGQAAVLASGWLVRAIVALLAMG
mgnify:CR=1 FL=1